MNIEYDANMYLIFQLGSFKIGATEMSPDFLHNSWRDHDMNSSV